MRCRSRVNITRGYSSPTRDRDVGIGLVVAQPDVERRPVALDQVLLQQQRLVLAAGAEELDLLDPLDQLGRLDRGVGLAPEVRLHPLSQRLGLAHVQHLAVAAVEQVHAGAVGQRLQLGSSCSLRVMVGTCPDRSRAPSASLRRITGAGRSEPAQRPCPRRPHPRPRRRPPAPGAVCTRQATSSARGRRPAARAAPLGVAAQVAGHADAGAQRDQRQPDRRHHRGWSAPIAISDPPAGHQPGGGGGAADRHQPVADAVAAAARGSTPGRRTAPSRAAAAQTLNRAAQRPKPVSSSPPAGWQRPADQRRRCRCPRSQPARLAASRQSGSGSSAPRAGQAEPGQVRERGRRLQRHCPAAFAQLLGGVPAGSSAVPRSSLHDQPAAGAAAGRPPGACAGAPGSGRRRSRASAPPCGTGTSRTAPDRPSRLRCRRAARAPPPTRFPAARPAPPRASGVPLHAARAQPGAAGSGSLARPSRSSAASRGRARRWRRAAAADRDHRAAPGAAASRPAEAVPSAVRPAASSRPARRCAEPTAPCPRPRTCRRGEGRRSGRAGEHQVAGLQLGGVGDAAGHRPQRRRRWGGPAAASRLRRERVVDQAAAVEPTLGPALAAPHVGPSDLGGGRRHHGRAPGRRRVGRPAGSEPVGAAAANSTAAARPRPHGCSPVLRQPDTSTATLAGSPCLGAPGQRRPADAPLAGPPACCRRRAARAADGAGCAASPDRPQARPCRPRAGRGAGAVDAAKGAEQQAGQHQQHAVAAAATPRSGRARSPRQLYRHGGRGGRQRRQLNRQRQVTVSRSPRRSIRAAPRAARPAAAGPRRPAPPPGRPPARR